MTAGLVLAAGQGRRMGGPQKLLLPYQGVALVRRAAEALLGAGLSPVVVVVGADAEAVEGELRGPRLQVIRNPRHAEGMGTSVAAGVAALGSGVGAVAVALGDMPRLRADTVRALHRAFLATGRGIAVPLWEGRRGHPVLFDLTRYRPHLLGLTGDEGARSVLQSCPDDVLEVPVDDPGVVLDVDTPEDFSQLAAEPGTGYKGREPP